MIFQEVFDSGRKENHGKYLKGFENNEFRIYLQFIVDNKTKKIFSAEALSRLEKYKANP